ncbi:tumor necrosis factor receptor superfamily member 13C isoform X2 [Nannospalax galili]|uniref:tumor necrosis factor receptor superfamily member 13C isoform X2 n=1 Tax=Nannospalax galili TaxID=1026970 RepID=UPI00111BDA46|nr:tumor necrosis factor receptor superfamily member 13C isoform X2 [Nannospalax galili]
MGATRRRVRTRRARDGSVPTPCVQAQCFDPLVRFCVSCKLLRTPDPRHAPSSQAPGTAQQPQESMGPDAVLPLPGLLLGAPALLGVVLALALVALVSWRWRQQRRMASPETPEGGQDGLWTQHFLSEDLSCAVPLPPLSAVPEEASRTGS